MNRRQLSMLALVLVAFVVSACSSPTGPTNQQCQVVAGSGSRCE